VITNLRVNQTAHELSVGSSVTVLDALRDVLGLTGTKKDAISACAARRAFRWTTRFHDPSRNRGSREPAITGMAAAIANAVSHATGQRIRSPPITIDKFL